MSAVDAAARTWVDRLQRAEIERSRANAPVARQSVARRLGVAPGTIENILRGRTKGLRGWMIERIRAAVIDELNREIAGAQHELEMALQSRVGPPLPEIAAVTAAVAQARKLINGQ